MDKAQEPLEWSFLQCFGERSPGEEVLEGESPPLQRGFPPDQGNVRFPRVIGPLPGPILAYASMGL